MRDLCGFTRHMAHCRGCQPTRAPPTGQELHTAQLESHLEEKILNYKNRVPDVVQLKRIRLVSMRMRDPWPHPVGWGSGHELCSNEAQILANWTGNFHMLFHHL